MLSDRCDFVIFDMEEMLVGLSGAIVQSVPR